MFLSLSSLCSHQYMVLDQSIPDGVVFCEVRDGDGDARADPDGVHIFFLQPGHEVPAISNHQLDQKRIIIHHQGPLLRQTL